VDLLDAQDAALLQLDLLLTALEQDMVLKDSTPYNVAVQGRAAGVRGRRLLRAHARGEPWVGYRQFCMLYSTRSCCRRLRACRSIPGCAAHRRHHVRARCAPAVVRDRFRRGMFTNVFLHARLEAKTPDRPSEVKQEV